MRAVLYEVDLSQHVQHLVTVTVHVPADVAAGGRLALPVWTPGSYVVRDYVRHVQHVAATAGGEPVALVPDGHSAWRLPDAIGEDCRVTLELYANELSVRTNHVDDRHALLVAAATFPCVEGAEKRTHEVRVHLPSGWGVWSLLSHDTTREAFVATDYDHLVDSAFEAGMHPEVVFDVAGVAHRFVWAGHAGRPDLDRIAADAERLGAAAVELFGGDLPVDRYTFLTESWNEGGGGLEHRDGSVLMVPVRTFQDPERYRWFLALVAHEYLHLWNVKRLTPAGLVTPDYQRPTHSPSLWVAEGWTSYYDKLLPLRAGLWSTGDYLEKVGEQAQRVFDAPARALHSVRQASHDAWTKFYVRDENWPNAALNYYDHGAILAWCLDLLLRRDDPDSEGLDAVLRLLWQRFAVDPGSPRGYTEDDVEAAVVHVADRDLGDFFADHVDGTAEPPLAGLVGVVGLSLEPDHSDDVAAPDLGVQAADEDDAVVLRSVLRDRPAWRGGLTGGDRLLAFDGERVPAGELATALRAYRPGDTVEVAVLRGPRLVTAAVTLGEPRPPLQLRPVTDPSDAQRTAFRRWSGRDLEG